MRYVLMCLFVLFACNSKPEPTTAIQDIVVGQAPTTINDVEIQVDAVTGEPQIELPLDSDTVVILNDEGSWEVLEEDMLWEDESEDERYNPLDD